MDNCHVFFDESGDFGFSGKSSKYVVLAAIFSENVRRLERIPRRIRAGNLKSHALRSDVELKFNSAFPQTRRRLLESVTELPCIYIGSIVLDKTAVNDFFAEHRGLLYLTMCSQLAREIMRFERIRKTINITFDRAPFHRRVTHCFKEHISNAIDEECRRLRFIPPSIILQMNSPGTCQGLIVADFIAGALHKKYSGGDSTYYRTIKDVICFETYWNQKEKYMQPPIGILPSSVTWRK
jgi:hypothetical protein